MKSGRDLIPQQNELPSSYSDSLGIQYTKAVSQEFKKENGQFFTPTKIAKLMASFSSVRRENIRILDPGCGTGVLSCALIENIVDGFGGVRKIDLTAFDTDPSLIEYSKKALDYLKSWLSERDIEFHYDIQNSDFILDYSHVIYNNRNTELFDIIISNPPYFKLGSDDPRTIAVQELVSGQPNIYSFFMGLASVLLNETGELVFITPRSFASGEYFKAFRRFFFYNTHIQRIHLFNSRRDTFNRDKVLQETVIIKARKGKTREDDEVIISTSAGLSDIENSREFEMHTAQLIDLDTEEQILHLPSNDDEVALLALVQTWENKLSDFDIHISTGPVVSFRAEENICSEPSDEIVPLFWLHNIRKMVLEWPKSYKDKGQYMSLKGIKKSILLPNKNYIFLRRFSTKDDSSRLIAAPYFCNLTSSYFIGVENKVNYIYRKKGHLDRNETVGLCALLNSELFDTYFQIFNGNVNVSATELRSMRFPNIEVIRNIGEMIILSNDYSVENVNLIINGLYTWNHN